MASILVSHYLKDYVLTNVHWLAIFTPESLLADLIWIDIVSHLHCDSQTDPNANYNKVHECLSKLKDKRSHVKFVKYKRKYKNKGNKWTTGGIIRSMKYRYILYRILEIQNNLLPTLLYLKKLYIINCSKGNEGSANNLLWKWTSRKLYQYEKIWNIISEIIHKSKNKSMNIKNIWGVGGIITVAELRSTENARCTITLH